MVVFEEKRSRSRTSERARGNYFERCEAKMVARGAETEASSLEAAERQKAIAGDEAQVGQLKRGENG